MKWKKLEKDKKKKKTFTTNVLKKEWLNIMIKNHLKNHQNILKIALVRLNSFLERMLEF